VLKSIDTVNKKNASTRGDQIVESEGTLEIEPTTPWRLRSHLAIRIKMLCRQAFEAMGRTGPNLPHGGSWEVPIRCSKNIRQAAKKTGCLTNPLDI
jgi:hypothetical protein